MVSVTHSLTHALVQSASGPDGLGLPLDVLAAGLSADDRHRIERAAAFVDPLYQDHKLGTGEECWRHALGMALVSASLKLDVEARLAALLFAVPDRLENAVEKLSDEFGAHVAQLVEGLRRLNGLRLITRGHAHSVLAAGASDDLKAQSEVLRKMMLAMVEDIRVVLLRLASRIQTLRYYAEHPGDKRTEMARETLDIYAPLANRLGVWQVKWEMEDLSFRFLEPETYKRIARMLDEKRAEREDFITHAVARLKHEVAKTGVHAEVYGRPKHIFSIWNKMRGKDLDFSEVYDVRALRVLVPEVKDCYTVLGIVHQIWMPIPKEFDDYISNPKGNDYRSLHTAVAAEDGRSLEVQIRTHEMHHHAELGVAAHWRYKESGAPTKANSSYDDKISLLRQLLSWRDEIADSGEWVERFKRAALDDTIYVLTPQGRVIDMPRGATPVDFAYRLHTDLGHHCRGAKVDGQLVPLNTQLQNGQRVEIVSAKQGGPSRDWLNPQLGYLVTHHAKAKVKRWFATLEQSQTLAQGRAFIVRELQREGMTQANIEDLAHKLGFENPDAFYLAAGRNEIGPRQLQVVLRGPAPTAELPELTTRRSKAGSGGVLVVGVDKLLTTLGRCCKPVPPDDISGFVTQGKGVSIHRTDCSNFAHMVARHPERVVSVEWGEQASGKQASFFSVSIRVEASDRQGLLRDISEVLSREKINVTAVNTQSRAGVARMGFTMEVTGVSQLNRALLLIREIHGVSDASRG